MRIWKKNHKCSGITRQIMFSPLISPMVEYLRDLRCKCLFQEKEMSDWLTVQMKTLWIYPTLTNFIDVFVGRTWGVYLCIRWVSMSRRLHLHISTLGALGHHQCRRIFDGGVWILWTAERAGTAVIRCVLHQIYKHNTAFMPSILIPALYKTFLPCKMISYLAVISPCNVCQHHKLLTWEIKMHHQCYPASLSMCVRRWVK